VTNSNDVPVAGVVVGVYTHSDEHVAVAIDHLGARLGQHRLRTTRAGYDGFDRWAASFGKAVSFGVEGAGSYGAGLTRSLAGLGRIVIKVNRPDRSTRRRLGKSDPIDAEMAARAVLAGVAKHYPKSGLDNVEMIRMLKVVKDSAIKARTQAINQMKALIVTAPVELRHTLAGLNVRRLVSRCVKFRPWELVTPLTAAKHALRSLARRHDQLNSEIDVIDSDLVRLTSETAPALVNVFGIGPGAAATLLVAAGSNPERLRSEAAFAALCGVNPIPASSGKTNRHRLNRDGDRQANSALYRIVLVRLRYHEPTKECMSRRVSEGMTKLEVIRCLKRYVARQICPILRSSGGNNIVAVAC
jgi:transposase